MTAMATGAATSDTHRTDLLVGAWKMDDGGTDAGAGYLMYGGAMP